MAALTADRNTPMKGTPDYVVKVPVAASTKIYAGALVAVNASGLAVPAADSVGFTVMGRAEAQADNSAGAASAIDVEVAAGIFKYGAGAIVQANLGANATCSDDQTVTTAAATTNDIVAGKIVQVDSDGVWIKVG